MIPTDLFIVTFARDFVYLKYCLLSIGKFCRRFNYLRILVPHEDVEATQILVDSANILFPVRVEQYQEVSDKGMLLHMRQIMYADTFTDGELIAHLDADCIFTRPVEPTEFFNAEGKPFLRYEPFATIGKRHAGILEWQRCTQACLPFQVVNETMRCHPGVFHRSTYPLSRAMMIEATSRPVETYIMSGRNSFPQTFCEFNTLGNVALEKQRHLYEPVLQRGDAPDPPTPIQQFWSHGSINDPQEIWTAGKPVKEVPMRIIEEVLSRPPYHASPEEVARMSE